MIQAVVSVDGFIALADDTVGPLFDWYVVSEHRSGPAPVRATAD